MTSRTESCPFNSSVYLLTLDSYSIKRLKLTDVSEGDEVFIRPKSIVASAHPSDPMYRRIESTFYLKLPNGDVRDLSFVDPNGDKTLVFKSKHSTYGDYSLQNIVLSVINSLAKYIATGQTECSKSPPRNSVFIHFKSSGSIINEKWEVVNKEIFRANEFNEDLCAKVRETIFKKGQSEYRVTMPYLDFVWLNKSCEVFCKRFLRATFVKQTQKSN